MLSLSLHLAQQVYQHMHTFGLYAIAVYYDHLTHAVGILQELVMFLQRPPTTEWGEGEVEFILSRAYMWRITYGDAPSHWKQT